MNVTIYFFVRAVADHRLLCKDVHSMSAAAMLKGNLTPDLLRSTLYCILFLKVSDRYQGTLPGVMTYTCFVTCNSLQN